MITERFRPPSDKALEDPTAGSVGRDADFLDPDHARGVWLAKHTYRRAPGSGDFAYARMNGSRRRGNVEMFS